MIMRSLRNEVEKIWENPEPKDFPFIPCYMSLRVKRGERSGQNPSDFEFRIRALLILISK